MKRMLVGVGLAAAVAALAGCGSDSGAARALEGMLPRLIGPANRFEVRASRVSGDRVGSARVWATRLQTDDGLVVDHALLDLTDLRFNRERRELLGVGRAEFTADVLQEHLNLYLQKPTSLVRGLRIRLTPQGAQVRGSADIPGVRLPITPESVMDGKLQVDELGRLTFDPYRIRVAGVEVPSVAAKLLATQINPLVDLTGLRLPVHLYSVEPGLAEVRLTGRALLPAGRYPDAARW